ncbi:MAG TPA: hypothetical protein VF017_06675 [Thermoanaerobaculia bacterium]|nr:hypothetical protein [Thermoanaerobaculia bacterium]
MHSSHDALLARPAPSFLDVLLASPFDPNKNLSSTLDEGAFFSELFVETAQLRDLADRIKKLLSTPLQTIRVLFLEGFSGIGKSTFLHYLERRHLTGSCVFLDFGRLPLPDERPPSGPRDWRLAEAVDGLKALSGHDSLAPEIAKRLEVVRSQLDHALEIDDPVAAAVKRFLVSHQRDELEDVLYELHTNLDASTPYFSKTLVAELARLTTAELRGASNALLLSATFSDIFLLLFLCQKRIAKRYGRVCVILDNLDAIHVDYLSDYFRHRFAWVLTNATMLFQDSKAVPEEIDFVRDYVFIFCLRDANNAVLNAHIADSIGHSFHAENLRLFFDVELYPQIVSARTKYFKGRLTASSGQQASEGFADAVKFAGELFEYSCHDDYLRRIALPLFNGDYRKVVQALFTAASSEGGGPPIGLRRLVGESENDLARRGLRGTLLYYMTTFLFAGNFLRDYPFFTKHPRADPKEGYCLHARMVLTALLNLSNLKTGRAITQIGDPLAPIPLSDILAATVPTYPVGEVVGTIVDAFLAYRKNWVNLVTIRGRPVMGRDAFGEEVASLETQAERDALGERSSMKASFEALLQDVQVTLNPAAFVFLRFLLTHFEFYSALCQHDKPLFSLRLEAGGSGNGKSYRYAWARNIVEVQRIVRSHLGLMGTFYRRKFEGERGWTSKQYRRSVFSFKHSSEGAPSPEGIFHSTRIIASHIDYVDTYRLYLLQGLKEEERSSMGVDINRMLLGFIGEYIRMLEGGYDDATEGLARAFWARIHEIREKKYEDFVTKVEAR